MKKKDEEPAKPDEPPEDPEVLRKRKEFLMSGVPTELKKQALNDTTITTCSDYVPFPEINHVQQLTDYSVSLIILCVV